MADGDRYVALRVILVIIGLVFLFGIYPLMFVWPAGWQWQPSQYEYEQMIVGVYAVLGIFLIRAAQDPVRDASLIWFTVWSSAVHAAIMLVQAFVDPEEYGHFLGDIPALFIIAIVLAALAPRRSRLAAGGDTQTPSA